MAATVYTASTAADLEYGIVNETNIILTSFTRNVSSVKTEVRDADNDVVAVAYSGLTAAITLDGFINGTATYDVAALPPILAEAGGEFFDWNGETTIFGGNGIATNAALAPLVRKSIVG